MDNQYPPRGFPGGRGGFRAGAPSYYGPPPTARGPPPPRPMATGPPGAPSPMMMMMPPPQRAMPPRAFAGRPPPMMVPAAGAARGFPPQAPHPHHRPPMPATATTAPLPAGWTEHVTPQGMRYYHNASTGVSQYDRPVAPSSAIPTATVSTVGPTSTAAVAAAATAWVEYKDQGTGQSYYYNTVTKATTWEEPEEYRIQQARAEVEKMKTTTEAEKEVEMEETRRKEEKKREAEQKLAKTFEAMPKAERVDAFKAFLEEKQVSPQFKWQEAVRLITKEKWDSDGRWKYALTSAGERKQAFAEYCTQVVNKQNIERRRQAKRVREEFLELLAGIEDKVDPKRLTWEDVNEGAEFYGLRKDARWSAIEESKERKDLFEGFLQDLERQRTLEEAKARDEFKDKLLLSLREKAREDSGRALFSGKRRLDGDMKKAVWDIVEELQQNTPQRVSLARHDVYTWTEEFLDALKIEEAELWKAEKQQRKQQEDAFASKLDETLPAWLESDKIAASISWQQFKETAGAELALEEGNAETKPLVSERRRRRIFDKKIRQLRLTLEPAAGVVKRYLEKVALVVNEGTTYEAFTSALASAIRQHLDDSKPEDGEEAMEELPTLSDKDDAGIAFDRELVSLVGSTAAVNVQPIAFPLRVKHVFQLLGFQVSHPPKHRENGHHQANGSRRHRSNSPTAARKRHRDASTSPSRRSRSPSARRSLSRSRSRSRSRSHRSRSQSRDPRAAMMAPTYENLPFTTPTKRPRLPEAPTSLSLPQASTARAATAVVVDEAARAEEIIRQARLKLLAKQEAKRLNGGSGDDSELEEGEELEDGEVTDEEGK